MPETNSQGLTSQEAQARLAQFGPNEVVESRKFSAFFTFLVKFKNPLVLILVVAAFISALTGDPVSALIIIGIVFLSVVLDFFNTYKSHKAAEDLKQKVQILVQVRRDGKVQNLPLHLLVPGDVVELEAGEIIPADGSVLSAKDLFLNEASLTGESFPVEKDLKTKVFLGTSVVSGTGSMLVEKTGRKTKFSQIGQALEEKDQPTDFDRGIKDFSYLIMKITFILVIFIFFVNAILKGSHYILESFLFSAALAVGLTPELLPMIIALNLSKGSLAMSKHGVIVKKLSAIQNFGSMDVLCTDKTGTLTEDKIALVKYVNSRGESDEEIFKYAYLSSSFRSGFKNPLDLAVKNFKQLDIAKFKKIDEIPFDFERRRDSVVVDNEKNLELVTKGAPEELFKVSKFYGKEDRPLSAAILADLNKEYELLSRDGFRVLGVAKKSVPKQETYSKKEEIDLVFLGFIAFLDPPKKTVTETLRVLEQHGLEIKIVTGDNELVTQKIASEIKLPVKGLLRGADLDKLSDKALALKAQGTTIFARVTPQQKKRIIELLRQSGRVVGYLGDGINDAPSLKAADVGISVNNAVNVAKESADLILLHKSLGDLVNGVIQGRRTFSNTMKYLMMALSSNFGNMFSMAGASAFFKFLPMLPTQILFNNLLYDSSQFTLPLDNVDPQELQKPRKLDLRFIKKFMLVFGPLSSVFDFLTFLVLSWGFGYGEGRFQTGWFMESLATQALVIFIIRTKKLPFFKSEASKYLVASVWAAVLVGWFFALSGLGVLFKFTPLPWPAVAVLVLIILAYLFVVELAKKIFYRKFSN